MTEIKAFKGFDKNLQCRGFQYEVGSTYKHEGDVKTCEGGFHACENPLNVFDYYSPSQANRFAVVKLSGDTDKREDKIAAAKIHIEAELPLHEYIEFAVKWVVNNCKKLKGNHSKTTRGAASNSGTRGAASNSGYYGAASNSGARGAASNSGYYGAASNSGTRGAASNSGDGGAASNSGARGAASNSGYGGAASNSGTRGAASNSGYYGAASNSGARGAASNSGYGGAAMGAGYGSKVMGCNGSALFLVERGANFEIINVWSGIVGKDGVKADTWYMLTNGELTEV